MADKNNFFKPVDDAQEEPESENQEEQEQQDEALESIKLGEKEYSQDELNQLVDLGAKLQEFEDKQGQSFDEVVKSWGERGNQIGELKKKLSEYESGQLQEKIQNQGYQNLSQEEQDQLADQELKRLGYAKVDDLRTEIRQEMEAQRLIDDASDFIEEVKEQGKPETTVAELLQEMQRSEKSMEEAYEEMFPSRLKAWEEEQVERERPKGYVTDDSPSGSKEPKPFKISRDNLGDAIEKSLSGEL